MCRDAALDSQGLGRHARGGVGRDGPRENSYSHLNMGRQGAVEGAKSILGAKGAQRSGEKGDGSVQWVRRAFSFAFFQPDRAPQSPWAGSSQRIERNGGAGAGRRGPLSSWKNAIYRHTHLVDRMPSLVDAQHASRLAPQNGLSAHAREEWAFYWAAEAVAPSAQSSGFGTRHENVVRGRHRHDRVDFFDKSTFFFI